MLNLKTVIITKIHSNFTGVKMRVNNIRYDYLSDTHIYTCEAEDGFEYQFTQYDVLNID